MSKATSPAIQKVVAGLGNLFSTHGALTMAERKFQNEDNSYLFYGCRYHRNLITDLPNQYCGFKPKFAAITDELGKHPEDFTKTQTLMQQIAKNLFGFESFARFQEIDVYRMLQDYHKYSLATEHNNNPRIVQLRQEFLSLVEELRTTSALEFGIIYMPDKLHITANITTQERNSWSPDGPSLDTKKIPSFKNNKNEKFVQREVYGKTGTGY